MKVTRYKINGPENRKFAIVCDLHEHSPNPVLDILRKEQLDAIFCPGDMLERKKYGPNPRKRESGLHQLIYWILHGLFDALLLLERLLHLRNDKPSKENGFEFFKQASKIAPIYYSVGNHEWYFTEEDREMLQQNQVVLLDNQDIRFDDFITLGGFSSVGDENWLSSFGQKEGYKILLNHHPEYTDEYSLNEKADLILSGHAHGGLFQIGKIGVFAPGQGFFPKYIHGIYGNMIVSAGCANTTPFPRIGSPCEVVIIEMKKEQ